MTLLWCSGKFAQFINLAYVIKLIFNPSLWNIDNIAPSIVNIYLGLRPRGNIPALNAIFSERAKRASSVMFVFN